MPAARCSQRWRETSAEKRELDRLQADMVNEVRQCAEVHRQVRISAGRAVQIGATDTKAAVLEWPSHARVFVIHDSTSLLLFIFFSLFFTI